MKTPKFQEKLKQALAERGKSQSLLADYIGVSPSHLSRTAAGERPLDHATLVRIADFLDSSAADLAAGTEVEELARPAGTMVERDTYEDLLKKLQDATDQASLLESQLVAERQRRESAEESLRECRARTQEATREAREARTEAAAAQERASTAEQAAKRMKASLGDAREQLRARTTEIERLRGELNSVSDRADSLVSQVEDLQRQTRAHARENRRLQQHLEAANQAIRQNYDAYVQAEAGRQALAKSLTEHKQSAAATAVFSGLIGLGAGLLGGSGGGSRSDYDDFDDDEY